MTVAIESTPSLEMQPLLLDVSNIQLKVAPEDFDQLCLNNPDLRLELTKDRELIVMPPTGGESGEKNFDLAMEVGLWNRQSGLGRAFDSSTGYNFIPFGGGKLSPDVSWIETSRLDGVNIVGFIPIVPDFVIELRSATDNLNSLQDFNSLQDKMLEYRRLGVKLGLLINFKNQQVEIYRPEQETEILDHPESIDCGEVMPNFILSLSRIW